MASSHRFHVCSFPLCRTAPPIPSLVFPICGSTSLQVQLLFRSFLLCVLFYTYLHWISSNVLLLTVWKQETTNKMPIKMPFLIKRYFPAVSVSFLRIKCSGADRLGFSYAVSDIWRCYSSTPLSSVLSGLHLRGFLRCCCRASPAPLQALSASAPLMFTVLHIYIVKTINFVCSLFSISSPQRFQHLM